MKDVPQPIRDIVASDQYTRDELQARAQMYRDLAFREPDMAAAWSSLADMWEKALQQSEPPS
jgi:hypothetical protein